jgi:hypothetical protein
VDERFASAAFSLTIQRSIMKPMNDAVRDMQIQSRIVEPRRQEDAIEWLQGDAFRTLIDKLLTQLTQERLLLGRE